MNVFHWPIEDQSFARQVRRQIFTNHKPSTKSEKLTMQAANCLGKSRSEKVRVAWLMVLNPISILKWSRLGVL